MESLHILQKWEKAQLSWRREVRMRSSKIILAVVVTEEISHTRAKATGVFLLKKHTGLGRAGIARSFLLHLRLPHTSVDGNWEATVRWVVFLESLHQSQ